MATRAQIIDAYVRRGLQLIQIANGVYSRDIMPELNKINRELALLLGQPVPSGRLQRERTIQQLESMVLTRYAQMARRHGRALGTVIGAEAAFAQRVSDFANVPSKEALARAAASMLFAGAPTDAHWNREAQSVGFRIGTQLRTAWNNGEGLEQIRARLLGTGRAGRGGVMQSARDGAEKVVDTGIQSAANAGRHATWKANGVNAVRWFAILDPSVCPECGMRAGKLYDMNYKPIGHDVSMDREPPLHFWCRCMLIPEVYEDGVPKDSGKAGDRFETWLDTLSAKDQNDVLGTGRAQLWRDGNITLTDLIDQNGRMLPLRVLNDG